MVHARLEYQLLKDPDLKAAIDQQAPRSQLDRSATQGENRVSMYLGKPAA
jgi:hypothetical protein